MRAIVTIAHSDGTFANVGMNTRTIIGPYRRTATIDTKAREWAKGKPARIEWFSGSIWTDPARVTYINR